VNGGGRFGSVSVSLGSEEGAGEGEETALKGFDETGWRFWRLGKLFAVVDVDADSVDG
jgi:hypothetical protein